MRNQIRQTRDNRRPDPFSQVVTRDEIYAYLWPEYASGDGSDHPYDRQISDHKRKITMQIKKALKGKDGVHAGCKGELTCILA